MQLAHNGAQHNYYKLPALGDSRICKLLQTARCWPRSVLLSLTHSDSLCVATLPYSIRVLLESAVRNCDDFSVKEKDINTILNWAESSQQDAEIPFRPARVILQDFT